MQCSIVIADLHVIIVLEIDDIQAEINRLVNNHYSYVRR